MLVILAVSYFAHIVISLSYFFQNTNVWIIDTRKNGGSTQYIQALSKFKRHKDTTRVMHTLKCLVFLCSMSLWIIFAGKVRSKKVEG